MDVNMTDPKELLLQVLRDKDAGRARSKQTQVGPSELGGCRRKVWYRLNDQPETNDNELKLSAIMGTAIHAEIEKAITIADPKGEKYWVETSVEYNGMKAHIDLYIPETGDVIDWKTVKVKNLSYFPSLQQRWQVQVYGYLLDKSGKGSPRTVNLVAIARDGDERDVRVHSEPYDPKLAEDALNWLSAIKESADAPGPERDQNYCKFYCKYFDESGEMGCTGLKKERIKEDDIFIDNLEVDTSALKYLQLDAKIKELTNERESLKAALEGFTGNTNSGVSILWSTVSGRESVDTEEVEKLLGFVPKKQGQESIRLSVKHTGGK
jgi:CRISPR/Cas system-associated exonuclease Cas4 (RecB family)